MVSPNNSNEKTSKGFIEMDYITTIVTLLEKLNPESQKLFIDFLDSLETQDIQDMKEALPSAHPTDDLVS